MIRGSCFKPSEFRGYIHVMAAIKHAWLIKFWAPIPAVIAAGILSTYYFGITGTFWAVTGELPVGAVSFCSCSASMLKSGVILKLSIWKDRH